MPRKLTDALTLGKQAAGPLLLAASIAFPVLAVSQAAVVARVNGEAIYERELQGPQAAGSFESQAEEARASRLEHLIGRIELRQFLTSRSVATADVEVEREVAQLRKTPPSLGCPCCRYSSLDEYLITNHLTLADLRADTRNELGLKKHVLALWAKTYPTEAVRHGLMEKERSRIERGYVRAWQIFFNTFQKVDARRSPGAVMAEAKAKAEAASRRLQSGEDFARVAAQLSEDQTSRDKGGALGCILRETYGRQVGEAFNSLKPGEVSLPIHSSYGFHLVKWRPITDADLLSICRADFIEQKTEQVRDEIAGKARVERLTPRGGG